MGESEVSQTIQDEGEAFADKLIKDEKHTPVCVCEVNININY